MSVANMCLISHNCDTCSNKAACDEQEANAPLPLLDPANLGQPQFLAVVRKDDCLDCPKIHPPSLKLMRVVVTVEKKTSERKPAAMTYSWFGEYRGISRPHARYAVKTSIITLIVSAYFMITRTIPASGTWKPTMAAAIKNNMAERKNAELISAKLEANNNGVLKPGQATLDIFIEV